MRNTKPDGAQAVSLIPDSARQDLTRKITVCIEKAERATKRSEELDIAVALHLKKAEEFYIAAGQYIKTVKDLWPDDWLDIVEQDCGLGRSRAYEVMAIADGRTSLKEIRSGNAQRQKTLRERRKPESVTDGMSRTEPEPKPGSVEYERDKAECIALFQKAAAAEQELAEHKAAMKAACAAAEAKAEPATDLEVRWRQSLRNRVALQMGMPAHWDREFPDWRTYSIDADLVKLVAGAFAAWGELAAELARRETAGRAAKEAAE